MTKRSAHNLQGGVPEILRELHHLKRLGDSIMSKISEFASAQNAFNDQMDASITAVQADVKALNDKITELQTSPGVITAEDQSLLDGLQARGKALSEKLKALDDLTPPTPPVA